MTINLFQTQKYYYYKSSKKKAYDSRIVNTSKQNYIKKIKPNFLHRAINVKLYKKRLEKLKDLKTEITNCFKLG